MFHWLDPAIEDARALVEFGAGKFDKLTRGPSGIPRVGIEIHPRIAGDHCPPDVIGIIADMRAWEPFVHNDLCDVALLLDSLEHIPKRDGCILLESLMERFRKIIVFTPLGWHAQSDDPWGYDNEHNAHASAWYPEEFHSRGFRVTVADTYHGARGGAIFAVWERPSC